MTPSPAPESVSDADCIRFCEIALTLDYSEEMRRHFAAILRRLQAAPGEGQSTPAQPAGERVSDADILRALRERLIIRGEYGHGWADVVDATAIESVLASEQRLAEALIECRRIGARADETEAEWNEKAAMYAKVDAALSTRPAARKV